MQWLELDYSCYFRTKQASGPTVASVNVGKDSQTAAINTVQGHVRHLTEQVSSQVNRIDRLSVAAVEQPQSSDGRSIISI